MSDWDDKLDYELWQLRLKIEAMLDQIHDQAIRNFDRLARSTGQRTRTDRATK